MCRRTTKFGTLWKNWCITKIHEALQKKTGFRNLQTGPRNHKQEPLLFPSSVLGGSVLIFSQKHLIRKLLNVFFCQWLLFVVYTQTLQALFGLVKIVQQGLEQETRLRQETDSDIRAELEKEVEGFKPGRLRVLQQKSCKKNLDNVETSSIGINSSPGDWLWEKYVNEHIEVY